MAGWAAHRTCTSPAPHQPQPAAQIDDDHGYNSQRLKYKSRFLTFTDKMFISAQGSRAALAQYGADTGQHQRGHSTQL